MGRHDVLKDPAAGPDGMYRSDAVPSRGQLHTIAHLSAQLLGAPLGSRMDAQVMIVRLYRALEADPPPGTGTARRGAVLMGERLDKARRLFATLPHSDAVQLVMHEERCLQQRREDRQPTGRGRHRLKCTACNRFVRNISQPCRCGWAPGRGWAK